MSYELIVCEKPSAMEKIAKALADGKPIKKTSNKVAWYEITRGKQDIVVASAVGHLYTVAEKEKSFNYPSFDLEWKPGADVNKASAFSKKYLNVIKKLAKGADKFTVATDYDIEGEVIGLNIIRFLAKKEDARRMKFSTLTKEDLIKSYEEAEETLNWGQANAGETRHFLDWIYGINLSRALMDSVKKAGSFKILSIGRVQGPALKILVDKEHEINAFVPKTYWQIKLNTHKNEKQIEASHAADKIWEKDKADWFFNKAKEASEVKVLQVARDEYKQNPPNPFDLGALQREAYRHFKISPKAALETAQKLYTAGYISYPRTSSQILSPKIGFKKILEKLAKNSQFEDIAKEVLKQKTLKPNNGKKKDPAHPAIYPTGVKPPTSSGDYSKKIYDLIVKRFIATFGKTATRETIKIGLDANGELFLASGKRTVDPQWHVLYAPYVKQEEAEVPNVREGDALPLENIEQLEKQTEPPRRYTPASIIKELEKRDLGTKATRAEIVDSLSRRGYVDGQSLKATIMGIKTVETLEKYCSEILDEELTRHFEREMESIRRKRMKPEKVLDESKKVLTGIIEHFSKNIEKIGEELKVAYHETLNEQNFIGKCPNCEGTLMVRKGKSRKQFAACDKYPECTTTFPLPQGTLIRTANKECQECKHPMLKLIRARRRPQEACLNPECPTKKVEQDLPDLDCDKCGGKLTVKTSVYGSFYGCSGYPKCRNIKKIEKKESEK